MLLRSRVLLFAEPGTTFLDFLTTVRMAPTVADISLEHSLAIRRAEYACLKRQQLRTEKDRYSKNPEMAAKGKAGLKSKQDGLSATLIKPDMPCQAQKRTVRYPDGSVQPSRRTRAFPNDQSLVVEDFEHLTTIDANLARVRSLSGEVDMLLRAPIVARDGDLTLSNGRLIKAFHGLEGRRLLEVKSLEIDLLKASTYKTNEAYKGTSI